VEILEAAQCIRRDLRRQLPAMRFTVTTRKLLYDYIMEIVCISAPAPLMPTALCHHQLFIWRLQEDPIGYINNKVCLTTVGWITMAKASTIILNYYDQLDCSCHLYLDIGTSKKSFVIK
jgi:hypothetical protein